MRVPQRHYRHFGNADAVPQLPGGALPPGGNCAVLFKGYLKTKNWIEFSAFQIYPKRFCGKKNGNDIKGMVQPCTDTQHQMSIDDYLPPYEGELVQENRWVRLAQAIDWDAIEQSTAAILLLAARWQFRPAWRSAGFVQRAAQRTAKRWRSCAKALSAILLGFDSFTMMCRFLPAAWSGSVPAFPARVREAVIAAARL
ncbi:MAG: hypothetical protein ACLVHY_03680 [Gemmiger sp.]